MRNRNLPADKKEFAIKKPSGDNFDCQDNFVSTDDCSRDKQNGCCFFRHARKVAYTLVEVIIALTISSVVLAITLPILKNSIPTSEESMHEKTTNIVDQVITRLIESEVLYPKTTNSSLIGFQNTALVTIDGVDYSGNTKFCELFASQFASVANVNCKASEKSFSTSDGVDWYLPVTDFSDGYATIIVDVNGPDGQNCLEGICDNPDRFLYFVRANGTLTDKIPTKDDSLKYNINLSVTTPEGGKYSIAEAVYPLTFGEEFSGASHSFTELTNGKTYILKAVPSEEYTHIWSENGKNPKSEYLYYIKLSGTNRQIKLAFNEKPAHCVMLKVYNCAAEDLSECISTPTLTNNNNGAEKSMSIVGEPRLNKDTGEYYADTTATTHARFVCGVVPGSYSLDTDMLGDYTTSSGATTYSEQISLGNQTQTYRIYLKQKQDELCTGMNGTVWNGTQCVCQDGSSWDSGLNQCTTSGS